VTHRTRHSEERFTRFSDRDEALVRWRFGEGYVARLTERRYREMFEGATRILDVGCGVGEAAIYAAGADYVGIDLSETLVRVGHQRPGRRLAVADITRLPFAEGAFDRVSCLGVLHHLSRDAIRPALCEMARVLESGGEIAIIEPNPWNPYQRMFAWARPPERGILNTSPRALRRLIASVPGLAIARFRYGHTMPLPSLATFLLRHWRWPTGPQVTPLLEWLHRWAVRLRPGPLKTQTFWRLRKQ
jgi:SAM-dependent methyltransferase